jgi:hypothetical protein
MSSPHFGLLPRPGLVMGQLSCFSRIQQGCPACDFLVQAFLVQERRIRLIGFQGQGSIVINKKKERERLSPKYLTEFVSKRKKKR